MSHLSRLLTAIALASFSLSATVARADLQISPMRILFNDGDRAASVNLKHIGETTTRYRISLHFYKFDASGQLQEIEQPTLAGDRFAGELIRFSPRMVTLEPGVTQAVRLLVRKDAALPQGEYRAHIEFQTFEEGDAELMASTSTEKISTALRAHKAIAIPVIVRHGALSAKAIIAGLAYKTGTDAAPFMTVALSRTGDRSIYGDVQIQLVSADGKTQEIGVVHGASVYDGAREFNVPLDLSRAKPAKGDRVQVTFKDGDTSDEVSREMTLNL